MQASRVASTRPVRDALVVALLPGMLLAGCAPTVGSTCSTEDLSRARRIAYAADGTPAYEGQALLVTSCGGGSYCHTQTTDVPRFGAPADLVFDPLVVDGAPDEQEAQARLLRAISATHRHRNAVYASVVGGSMPPVGRPPVPDLREAASAYRTYASATDTTGTPLPNVQSPEGEEILRNWLACGSPVVERTTEPTTIEPCTVSADCPVTRSCDLDIGECRPVGDIVERRATGLEPTWTSIFTNIVRPSCATTGCHVGASAFNMLDLSNQANAYTALTTRDSSALCGAQPYVTGGDPSMSLLIDKLQLTPSCGGRMPPSGLSADAVAVIEEWVMLGAMND